MSFNFNIKTTKTDAKAADNDSKTKPAMKFSFDFKKTKDDSNESSQTKPSGFKFSPTKSADGDDTKPKFQFNIPKFNINKNSNNSTKEKSDKEVDDSAKPKMAFQFNSFKSNKEGDDSSQPKAPFQFNFSKDKKDSGDSNKSSPAKFSFGAKSKASTLTFNFGTGKDFQAEKKEFSSKTFDFKRSFSPKTSASTSQSKDGEDVETVEENGFCASEKTGEEDEEILLNIPAKLFIFEKPEEPKNSDPKAKKEQPKPGYAERGTGTLHFNYNKEKNYYRMIFRRKPIETLVLNQRIFAGMTPRKQGNNSIQFLGQIIAPKKFEKDETKNKDTNENKLDILLLKCKDEESANKLLSLIQKAISENQ